MLTNFNVPATVLTEEQIAANKQQFLSILRASVQRPGIENLIAYLENSDFFVAPASTKFHNCYKGGLCEHSLNVLYCLEHKIQAFSTTFRDFPAYSRETIVIVALLHDLSKANFYTPSARNQKVYSDNGSKSDFNGLARYDWETTLEYSIPESQIYTHGEESAYRLAQHILLMEAERAAVRWHMGFTENEETYKHLRAAMELYRLVLALQEADLESTYYIEGREAIG